MNQASNQFVKGALLLTLAGLISKVLSAGYRVPLQNLTGDLGFYIYQQVYPLLGIVIVLSLYGFPAAISKITAELRATGQGASLRSFYLPVFIIMLSINGMIFFIIYINSHMIADQMGDENLAGAYRLAAFTFLLMPFTSLLRGVFQGHNKMKPTAYSQVIEQLVRVGLIITISYLVFTDQVHVYKIGEAAVWATLIGAIAAIVVLGLQWLRKRPFSMETFPIPWMFYIKSILLLGFVASLNHMVLLIIQFADVFTLVPGLMKYGLSNITAMAEKGIFDRGQPLIQLGAVLGSSFALALIPALSKQKMSNHPQMTSSYIQSGLLFSFYLSFGAMLGLIFIFPAVNVLLFQDLNGTFSLQILSIAIFLSSISITASSILQGLGYFKSTAVYIIGAFLVKWITNLWFVPLWGITGSAFATICSLLFLSIFVILELHRRIPAIHLFKKVHGKAFAAACLGMVIYLLTLNYLWPYDLISSRIVLLLYVVCISVTGAFIYLLLLLKCRAFTKEEILMLPGASILIKVYQGRDKVEK